MTPGDHGEGRGGDWGARVASAERILRAACGPRVKSSFALAPLTSFRIGGPAALYLEPENEEDLAAAAEATRSTDLPWFVIGKGSNVLIADAGFPGLALRLGRGFRWASRDGERLHAGAAMPLPALTNVALAHGLSGMEFGVAIPGSVGGAVRMNAGAHGRAMVDALEAIDLYSLLEARRTVLSADEARFEYRRSSLPPGSVIVGCRVLLRRADPGGIRRVMDEAREYRRATQPLAEPNCGSVFKNPPVDHAGRLVEAVGGKEMSVGGAAVSGKHANFIVTGSGATATDVRRLIGTIQDRVQDRFGVHLEPEVQFVGDFDLASI
jgi:UDP-N-acetylmuramate dehydrogenase